MDSSPPVRQRRLWFVTLASPIAWSVHFLTVYSLVEAVCRLPLLAGVMSAVPAIVLTLTAAALLVTVYAGWLAYQLWRRLERARPAAKKGARQAAAGAGTTGLDADGQRFMAVGGILLSGLFAWLMLMTALPALVLAPCW